MPAAISTVVVSGFTTLNSRARERSAISTEAQSVQQAAGDVVDRVERSQALFGSKSTAISQLWALANECADANWNADGALPIDHLSVYGAQALVRALPDETPLPEFAPEPDGSISLDWIRSRNCLFSMSVGRNNRLACAWLDGADSGHFVASFGGENVPPRILEEIARVTKGGNAPVGPR